MKLIKPSYEIIEQKPGLDGIYEQIELAGRTCYKSKRPEGQTAKDFVDRMIASQHYAMLEHGTVYLKVINRGLLLDNYDKNHIEDKYINNPYSKVVFGEYPKYNNYEEKLKAIQEVYITTNYRVLVENGWLDDLKYLCEPTEFHEKRVTVKFITDRGVSHELVRHRVFSFAQESTRYCDYTKDKFGNELTFIMPSWLNMMEGDCYTGCEPKYFVSHGGVKTGLDDEDWSWATFNFVMFLQTVSRGYRMLQEQGWTPQQARQVLPNALKTEIVMTGFASDWKHFFDLRTSIFAKTGKPHPDMSTLADPLYLEFVSKGYCNASRKKCICRQNNIYYRYMAKWFNNTKNIGKLWLE